MTSRNICLLGMMGSGKSTVSRELGARLGRRVVDTDREIERWAGRDVAAVFADEGEEGFRAREHEVVSQVARLHDLVVALGGGAVLRDDNVDALRLSGVLVHLDPPLDTLVERLGDEAATRPLLPDGPDRIRERVASLVAERADRYAAVRDVRFDGIGPPDAVASQILDWAMAMGDVLTPSEHEQVMT
jgi:shikimate kinase